MPPAQDMRLSRLDHRTAAWRLGLGIGVIALAAAVAPVEAQDPSLASPGSTPYVAPSPPSGEVTPIDGTYTTSFSRDELAASPLLYDQSEVNDGNWGTWVFTFDRGTFNEQLRNPVTDFSAKGTYSVTDDLVTIIVDQGGGPETFGLRWSLDGETLTFTRDPGSEGPTPWLLEPWTRSALPGT